MSRIPARVLSPELQHWMDKGQFHRLQKRNIFAIDEGNADLPVILLIHGFPTSSWDFVNIWNSLARHYRLISLDMLGFGFSDKPDNRRYKISKQADLFELLVARLQIAEFHILAHDYGVSVAQELLSRQQQGDAVGECLSCCFLNGGLFPESHRARLIQKLLLSPAGKLVNHLNGFRMFSNSFSGVFGENTKPTRHELTLFWELINFNGGKHVFHNLITYMNERRQYRERWLSALQSAKMPLALINGSADPVSGSHMVDRYRNLGCRLDYLAQIEEVGHYPQAEDPVQVAGHYFRFLRQVANRDSF
ncbi:MAG: alpha/beta hydrolase [Gammaproteobacteria bacterium]|nr:alpha/beta hydrolase [Gammaproteobacteria bacterium]